MYAAEIKSVQEPEQRTQGTTLMEEKGTGLTFSLPDQLTFGQLHSLERPISGARPFPNCRQRKEVVVTQLLYIEDIFADMPSTSQPCEM